MRDELDTDIAELYPEQPTDDLRLARLRAGLFAETPRRRFSWKWAGAAAAAVALVITGTVATLQPKEPVVAAPNQALLDLANRIEADVDTGPFAYKHFQWGAWRTDVIDPNPAHPIAARTNYTTHLWVPREPGQPVILDDVGVGISRLIPGIDHKAPASWKPRPQGPELWSTRCTVTPCPDDPSPLLPDDPAALMEVAARTFMSPFSTNKAKAEIYRKIAATPGVSYHVQEDNGLGRVKVEGTGREFLVDPNLGAPVLVEDYRDAPDWMPKDIPMVSVTLLGGRWTDERPHK